MVRACHTFMLAESPPIELLPLLAILVFMAGFFCGILVAYLITKPPTPKPQPPEKVAAWRHRPGDLEP
jgi:hypothetical protein